MNKFVKYLRPIIFLLCCLLVSAQVLPTELNIVVLQGEGAVNAAGQRAEHAPTVRVDDENHKPVEGVAVVFTLPTEGATGEFGNGSKTLATVTDKQGLAEAHGLRFNRLPGKVPIQVNVSYRGLTARTTITEMSALPPGVKADAGHHGHGALIAILLIVGAAGAGGGAYFATHKSSSPTSTIVTTGPAAIGITPGTGTIVGGH